ncbi:hypothetical protein NC652_016768 [Populus alba x Populus x berolinensis]|nr:hypothetical protein NC652_016768 [Populus alba x Populus x berolinensis]
MHHWLYSIVSITAMYLWWHLMLIILQLCIAVPCHVFKLWAFIGIMLQVPLVVITKFLQNKFRSSMVCPSLHLFISQAERLKFGTPDK